MLTFFIALIFNFVSNIVVNKFNNIIVLSVLCLLFVLVGILFDIIGTAVLSAKEAGFHAKSSKKIRGSKEGVYLVKNSSTIASICNDVIGDICGIVSGSIAAMLGIIIANKFNISFKECNNTDILNDVMMNGYNLGIIRVQADLEAKYKKMLTSKQMQFKEIWNFNCNVVFSKNHPLAGKDKLCFNDLKEYSVLLHDDEYVPFISKEELKKLTPSYDSSSKILIQERGSQFDILSRLTKTYMWATPIPQTLLDNHKLVMKKCIDNKQSFVDILIYPKNYSLSEFEKKFIENIFEIKYALENGENAD